MNRKMGGKKIRLKLPWDGIIGEVEPNSPFMDMAGIWFERTNKSVMSGTPKGAFHKDSLSDGYSFLYFSNSPTMSACLSSPSWKMNFIRKTIDSPLGRV